MKALLSILKISVKKNEDYNALPDTLVKLQRYYLSEGVYRTVQYDLSDEYGLVLFDVLERDVDYKLLYTDVNNTLLKSTEPSKFYCTAGLCDITQLIKATTTSLTKRVIVVDNTYSNTTKLITTNWAMVDGDNADIIYKVYYNPLKANSLVCNTTTTASSGVFTCNMSGYQGTALVILDVEGNSFSFSEFITLARQLLRDVMSQGDSMFLVVAILLVVGLSGLASPLATVIMSVFAVILMGTLGVFTGLTADLLVVVVIMGIMIGLKVKE